MKLEILALVDNKATVLIKGEIGQNGDNNALFIADQLKAISQNEIHIHIASEGGSLAEALSIRAEIKKFIIETGKKVIFHLEKMVASAATVVPMIKESRVIGASNMLFMLHPAYAAEVVVGHGTAADHVKTAEIIKEYTQLWAAALMEKSGLSETQVNEWILHKQTDTNLTALDALNFGFIDEIGAASLINASLLPKDLSGIPDDWLKANQIIDKKEYNVMTPEEQASITIYDACVRALGITALVGFLIGIVLSYLSALQLKTFGAEIYIIDILGLSIIRELGPLLAAILVAGRSGSSMTAQIGIMRVTEELDALSAMGISHSLRLILPKVTALTIVLPLLSAWTSASALIGGMFSAQTTLDISYQQFLVRLPDAVPLLNVFIGLGKSAVFGLMIALIACHFGFRIKPNTESLGSETTNSVVASITVVIMIDAMFAILFMGVGMP